jgi:hypothetical protein
LANPEAAFHVNTQNVDGSHTRGVPLARGPVS